MSEEDFETSFGAKRFKETPKTSDVDSSIEENPKSALELLPVEVLIEIFILLPPKDILRSTLVCKKFNEIISNDKKILKRIRLKVSRGKRKNEWIISRKYQNVSVSFVDFKIFLPRLGFLSESITDLRISNITDLKILRDFLASCVNLKNLFISSFNLVKNDDPIEPLPKHDLESLKIYLNNHIFNGSNFYKVVKDYQTKMLRIDQDHSDSDGNLRIFINNQTDLEELEIRSHFFSSLDAVKFRLKKLTILNTIKEEHEENFIKFLDNLKDSLTHLKMHIITFEIAETLKNFTKLQSFSVNYSFDQLSDFIKADTITYLKIPEANIKKFVNLRELVTSCTFTNVHEIKNLQFLERLTIDYHDDIQRKLFLPQNLKYLKLVFGRLRIPRRIYFDGTNLEELELIDYSCRVKWLFEYFERAETKLKILRITYSGHSSKIHNEVKEYRAKFDELEINGEKY